MKMTGQILKENRERKNISLGDVAIATKINIKILQALESGDLDSLPPKTFLRGFVRSYASYLGLDVEAVLGTFQDEMGTTRPKPAISESEASTSIRSPQSTKAPGEALEQKPSIAANAGIVAGILFVVAMIFVVKQKMESYEKEAVIESVPAGISSLNTPSEFSVTPTPAEGESLSATGEIKDGSITPPPSDSAKATSLGGDEPGLPAKPSSIPVASPTSSPTPSLTPTPKPTPTATATPMATVTPKATATPTATPTAKPSPKPSPTPTATPTPKPSPSATPSPAASASPVVLSKTQEVIVEALDNVDVEITVDGEGSKTYKLKSDMVQSVRAKRKIVLKISNAGAVNLIVNGVERGVPGDLGKPMRIELP